MFSFMRVPSYVKPYPTFWKFLPFTKGFGGNTIYPYIFLREDFYHDLLTENPHPQSIALLKHEEFHWQRQKKKGLVRFLLQNYLSPRVRLEEELGAYTISMQEWKKHGLQFPIEHVASSLSSWMYLWVTSYQNAKEQLEKQWKAIK